MAKLAAYQAKRDFAKTSEPAGGEEPAASGHAFVVQKHDATRLHYDLRLELDGVMKSWAVAKGPSLVPGDKRLAVHVEDHPIAYNTFEGTIPKGQYGGGTVIVWDRGTWTPEGDPHKSYAKGHLDFSLAGEKLHGRWHLVRLRPKPRDKQEAWLLIKSDDEHARSVDAADVLDEQPLSVASGRSIGEIASATDGAVWTTKPKTVTSEAAKPDAARSAPTKPRTRKPKAASAPTTSTPAASDEMPRTIEPSLATLVSAVPSGDGWWHEIKWDGYRLIVFKNGGTVRLQTRRGLDWTARFPAIATAVAELPAETLVLDGEAVVEDERGIASFSALQAALSDGGSRTADAAILFAFDLLYRDGTDLRALPLEERKARLAGLLGSAATGAVRLSEHVEGDGDAMSRSACRLGLEGIIAKRRDRPYRSGRTDDWLKIKCTDRQEFVIGGFLPSGAGRKAVGSVLLGYREADALVYAGRAGTGFTAEAARDLWTRLDPTRRKTSPFAGRLTADEKRGAAFVEPATVAEFEFRGWTADGRLRHAAFKGLREDKSPDEVVRERPADAGGGDASSYRAEPEAPEPAAAPAAAPKTAPTKQTSRRDGSVAGVRLSHPDRVLWDDAGVTKQGLAEFYETIAASLLPQIVGRPLSLVRCPNGAADKCFFQKHSWAGLSDGIRREMVRDEAGEEEVLFVEDMAGVIGLVQAGVLEIHPWGSRIDDVERADRIVVDLDPGDGVTWADVIAAAHDTRARLKAVGLEGFVKTTGGKGLHVVVPIRPTADWATVKGFAHALALAMEMDDPGRYIAKATKAARRGVIYVDYLRNGRGATAVAAYSTRARPRAPVSVPLTWAELDRTAAPDSFTVENLPARLAKLRRDPWAGMDEAAADLPDGQPARSRKTRHA